MADLGYLLVVGEARARRWDKHPSNWLWCEFLGEALDRFCALDEYDEWWATSVIGD